MPNMSGELSPHVAALIDKLAEMAAMHHVGHHHRLFMHASRMYAEIEANPDGINALRGLLEHPDAQIQHDAWRGI